MSIVKSNEQQKLLLDLHGQKMIILLKKTISSQNKLLLTVGVNIRCNFISLFFRPLALQLPHPYNLSKLSSKKSP
jgi:hypothetical protein